MKGMKGSDVLGFLYFPDWIKPQIIPGFPIRWYAVMYIIAFSVAYVLFRKQVKTREPGIPAEESSNFFFWLILGLLIGARILATLVYDTSGYYIRKPWLIFWPFRDGQFTGLAGMSYHGGVIGVIATAFIYSRRKKIKFFILTDMLALSIPLGFTFGRIGNFINGELWGRVTAVPWGMIFPLAPRLPANNPAVKSFIDSHGMHNLVQADGLVNLPRHPSQLYEALFEGIVLWFFLWFLVGPRWMKKRGVATGSYLFGYGIIRFFLEYLREPDADIGFIISLTATPGQTYFLTSVLNFTTGQLLCSLMMIAGIIMIVIGMKKGDASPPAGLPERSGNRKIRKKIKKQR